MVFYALDDGYEASQLEEKTQQMARIVAQYNVSDELIAELEDVLGSPETHWGMVGSVYFAMTVVTTIGYGNSVPHRHGSRAFAAVFAAVGIAYCGLALQKVTLLLFKLGRAACRSRGPVTAGGRMARAQLTFEEFDRDHSGTIDFAELHDFLTELDCGRPVHPMVVDSVFVEADADGSGAIEREELMSTIPIHRNS
eukprot:gene530-9193_t